MQVQRRRSLTVKSINHIPNDVLRWKEKKRQFRKQAENMDKLAVLFRNREVK